MRRKLTDEQLSRILGEHDVGQLHVGGAQNWMLGLKEPFGCILQVAYNGNDSACDLYPYKHNPRLAKRFDVFYKPSLSSEELLAEIGKNE